MTKERKAVILTAALVEEEKRAKLSVAAVISSGSPTTGDVLSDAQQKIDAIKGAKGWLEDVQALLTELANPEGVPQTP